MEKFKRALIFVLVYILVWIGLDFLFSLLRAAVWVFAKAFKSALHSAIITVMILWVFGEARKR